MKTTVKNFAACRRGCTGRGQGDRRRCGVERTSQKRRLCSRYRRFRRCKQCEYRRHTGTARLSLTFRPSVGQGFAALRKKGRHRLTGKDSDAVPFDVMLRDRRDQLTHVIEDLGFQSAQKNIRTWLNYFLSGPLLPSHQFASIIRRIYSRGSSVALRTGTLKPFAVNNSPTDCMKVMQSLLPKLYVA
jgi:hypothetical protein